MFCPSHAYHGCLSYKVGFCNAVSFPFGVCLHLCAAQYLFVARILLRGSSPQVICYLCCTVFRFPFVCAYVRDLSVEHHSLAKFHEAATAKRSANFHPRSPASPPPNNHSNQAVANFPGLARLHCSSQLVAKAGCVATLATTLPQQQCNTCVRQSLPRRMISAQSACTYSDAPLGNLLLFTASQGAPRLCT